MNKKPCEAGQDKGVDRCAMNYFCWIPAFAGMTAFSLMENLGLSLKKQLSADYADFRRLNSKLLLWFCLPLGAAFIEYNYMKICVNLRNLRMALRFLGLFRNDK
jgi:hypothetical protein